MIRRVPILVAGLALAAVLSSCSTLDTSAAARVNGDTIKDRVVETLLASDTAPGASDTTVASAISGDGGRAVLGYLIRAKFAEQVAERNHVDVTKARVASLAQIKAKFAGPRLAKWNSLSDAERNLVGDIQSAEDSMKAVKGAAPADLEQRYNDPKSTGYFCIRYLVLPTEAAAQAAYQELLKGGDFAKIATGVDPASNGGIAPGADGSPCRGINEFQTPAAAILTKALFSATPGKVVAPIKVVSATDTSWYLLLHRPWSEIGKDLTKKVAESPSFAQFMAEIATAKVSVASKYGVWDPVIANVVAHS